MTAAPTLSRRHAAGSESARGLLVTVLGELVLPSGGSAWTSAFIDVLGRLGVEEKASRQGLMRSASAGWLTSRRFGRRTSWTLTAAARRLLTEGAERIYGFRGAQHGWDGRWLLVLARTPETDRRARHLLRTRLAWAGFGSPAPGVWVSTHHGGSLAAMVRQAWDLDAIDAGYERFLASFSTEPSPDPPTNVVQLVHAWRRFPLMDPALPVDLLPAQWSGARAADLFQRLHDRWTPAAMAQWRRTATAAGTITPSGTGTGSRAGAQAAGPAPDSSSAGHARVGTDPRPAHRGAPPTWGVTAPRRVGR